MTAATAIASPVGPQLAKAPPVAAFREHAKACRLCKAASEASLPIGFLCQWGYVLAKCARKARARRATEAGQARMGGAQ